MIKPEWKMDSGPGTTRGACVSCREDVTTGEVLQSVCVNGTSQCYCSRCAQKPSIRKYKQGD